MITLASINISKYFQEISGIFGLLAPPARLRLIEALLLGFCFFWTSPSSGHKIGTIAREEDRIYL